MTQIAHICKHLLDGNILTIMDGYKLFACTNLPRELSRSVEKKFGVTISKVPKKFTSKYGHAGEYYQYRLNPLIPENKEGIKKMLDYIKEQEGIITTDKQQKQIEKIEKKVNNIYNQTPLL